MIKPAGYRMLIKPVEVEEKTAGGIILPEQVLEKDQQAQIFGTVVAMGEFCFKEYPANWCQVGDMVSTTRYVGFAITDPASHEQFRLINDLDVMAVITP